MDSFAPTASKIEGSCVKIRIGLISKEEITSFLEQIAQKEEFSLSSSFFLSTVDLLGERQKLLCDALKERFSTFFLGEKSLEEALNHLFIEKRAKVSFAESCTAGLLGASLVKVPGASSYFQGSIVAYSNVWKERFLHVRRDTLRRFGEVSSQTVTEMVEGLFLESDSDYALAVSGFLGPFEEERKAEVFLALGKRKEEIEVGKFEVPSSRMDGMEAVVEMALFSLFRKLMYGARTFQ